MSPMRPRKNKRIPKTSPEKKFHSFHPLSLRKSDLRLI